MHITYGRVGETKWRERHNKTDRQQEGLEWEEKARVDKRSNVDETVPVNIADNAGADPEKQAIPHPWPHLGELFEVVGLKKYYFLHL